MRIRRLNLLKYGHFEGTAIELPAGEADLHIIYGDNEAGKSTALAALENLLFGFPKSTPYSFKFAAPKLRIGAELADEDSSFEFLRRKGLKDTIVDEDGKAISDGEKRLAALLQGVDLPFFQRMFFLNHIRLRSGAEDLLAVGEDAGETLLASGAGIQGLAEILQGYDSTADSLWAKTGGQKRAFTQANKRLAESKKAEREASVNVTAYRRAKREAEQAAAAYESARENVEIQQSRLTKLERVRRVHRNVQTLTETETEVAALGDVAELPRDAANQLDTAERKLQQLGTSRAMYEDRIKDRKEVVASLVVDETFLQRASDIEALGKGRVIVEKDRDALPRRREDLAVLMGDVEGQLSDLGWVPGEGATAKDLLPAGPVVSKARNHAAQFGSVATALEGAETALADAKAQLKRLKERTPANETAADTKALRAAYTAAREGRKGVGARERAEQQRDKASSQATRLLADLMPAIESVDALRRMSVPSAAVIEHHRDAALSLVNQRDSRSDELAKLRNQLSDARQRAEKHRATSGVLSDSDLVALREERDAAWQLLSRRHLEKDDIPEGEWADRFGDDPVGRDVYEKLIADADAGADARFDKAEIAARLNALAEKIESDEQQVKAISRELERINDRLAESEAAWSELWFDAGVSPGTPDRMLSWCRTREAILERQEEVDEANVDIEKQTTAEAGLVAALIAEIKALQGDWTLPDDASLDTVLAYSDDVGQELKAQRENAESHARAINDAEEAVEDRQSAFDSAQLALESWQQRWHGILSELQLDTTIVAGDVEDYLELIELVRNNVSEADKIRRDRIEKIERDIHQYEERAKALADAIAKDLQDSQADEIVFALQARLAETQTNQQKRSEAKSDIEDDTVSLDDVLEQERACNDVIDELHRLAGTESLGDLQKAIRQSDEHRRLEGQKDELCDTLEADGDGHSIADLKKETEGVDLDKAAAEAQSLDGEVKSLTDAMLPLRDEMLRTKAAFEAIGTSGDAAVAASRIQSAYADMDSIAASFVRARTAERLLRWGIDYFRKQKLGPLLEKASALFNTVTGGRYARLILEYDGDTPIIAGIDEDGSAKQTNAMSEGTRDQLYLALKLAAVEDYVERAEPMPFVADDLFINFDDTRTAQALNALHEISKQCQVVLFTHHAHLVDIARSTIQDDVSVVMLG